MTEDSPWRQSVANTPRWLFKYMSVAGERSEFARQLIVDRELYFSSPMNFNDPYDCLPRFDAPKSKLVRDLRFRRRVKRAQNLTAAERVRANQIARNQSREDLIRMARDGFRLSMSKLGVTCLSKNSTSLAMWSHYADSHRGVQVVFDINKWPLSLPLLFQVQYVSERPIYDALGRDADREDQLFAALCRKALDWEREAEWRVLLTNGAGTKVALPVACIAGVVLGAESTTETAEMVRQWLHGTDIQLAKASLAEDAYDLVLKPYSDPTRLLTTLSRP